MKHATIAFVLVPLAGCDSAGPDDSLDLSGEWSTWFAAPAAGECCRMDLLLDASDGRFSGNGTVQTPSTQIGRYNEYSVNVNGTYIKEELSLTFDAGMRTTSFSGALRMGEHASWAEGTFSGFGERADNLRLYWSK